MWSSTLDKISFWSLFITLALLPIFFLPFTKIPVEISKGLLLVIGLAISFIFYLAARFSDGRISIPKSWLLLAGAGVVLATLLSSIFSSARGVSFFGTMFEVGTFWFIFVGFLLLFLCAVIFQSPKSARLLLLGLVIAGAAAMVFQTLRFFAPQILSFGVLNVKTDNLLGSWGSLGIFSGFTALLSLLLAEFFEIPKKYKWLLGVLLLLSLFIILLVNLPLVWGLLGAFALPVFIYKLALLKGGVERKNFFPAFSFAVIIISLLFFISGRFLLGALPNSLQLLNNEVRPTFSSTAAVARAAFLKDPLLGPGPNRFSDAWAMYKPAQINTTRFWNTSFDAGVGTLPTLLATTGTLGILSWLVFFALFLVFGTRSLLASFKEGFRPEETLFFFAALFLFVASFLYPTGSVPVFLALAATGIFLALARKRAEVTFFDDPRKSFFFILILVLLVTTSITFSFKYLERFAAVSYFSKAIASSSVPAAEAAINKTISLYKNDLYFRTYAQVYLLKLNSLVGKPSLSSEEQTELQATLREAVNGATLATQYNKENYLNFLTLGLVYDTLGSFGVPSAYPKAIEAYQTASALNPLNPGIKLDLARASQAAGQTAEAIRFAEEALNLVPDNAEIVKYIDSLKTPNSGGESKTQ